MFWNFLAKQKHEQIQSSIDQLKHKYHELEIAIEEQKKKLAKYENIHYVIILSILVNSYGSLYVLGYRQNSQGQPATAEQSSFGGGFS